MACKTQEQEIFYEASKVYWGKEECREITFVDDVAGSLTDEYFDLNILDQAGLETSYYVLLSGTTPATDPAPAGKTKITVTYTDGDTGIVIAGLAQVAIDAITGMSAAVVGAVLEVHNDEIGAISEEINTFAPSLTFVSYAGIGGYLGRTAEGIEISMETTVGEVLSNQTSAVLLDEIVQGQSGSCTAAFIELSKERLETLIAGSVGDTFTPSAGTKLIGGGSSRLSSSLRSSGGKMILHPIRLADEDRSRDFIFWLSAPKPESINYSGTDIQALNCTFTAYLDDSKPAAINLYAIGDWKQDGIEA
tara:strand:- start:1676 stop:2593 length:918 start_codon:yes stop_codon:yes gene_type:complete